MWNKRITGRNRKQSSTYGRGISDYQSNPKHTGSTVSKFCDGRCNKTDDDQRHAEVDELSEDIFQSNNDIQDSHGDRRRICSIQYESGNNAKYNAYQKFKRKAGKETVFFH